MRPIGVLACALLSVAVIPAQACDITYDPKPSWEEMIGEADLVFVGRVISTSPPDDKALAGRALFQVETPVKGAVGSQFDFELGTSSCDRGFEVGDHVIFAGETFVLSDGKDVVWVRDSGWDPTVSLSDPPTPEQQAKLDYLTTITEIR